jgi:hypothetical protein
MRNWLKRRRLQHRASSIFIRYYFNVFNTIVELLKNLGDFGLFVSSDDTTQRPELTRLVPMGIWWKERAAYFWALT